MVKNSKYPSKYDGYFCPAIGNTGVISGTLLTDCLCSFGQFAFKVISSCTVFVSIRAGASGYGELFLWDLSRRGKMVGSTVLCTSFGLLNSRRNMELHF